MSHFIDEIWISVDQNFQFWNPNHFLAYYGFIKRGKFVVLKTFDQLNFDINKASPEILIFAGVKITLEYLKKLNSCPKYIDYPETLKEFLNREIFESDLKNIRNLNNNKLPIFIKPIEQKLFTGHVIYSFKDLLKTVSFPEETLIFTSSVLNILSEWRCFIHKNKIEGLCNYKGNPCLFPNVLLIQEMINNFKNSPIAYGLDVGICLDEKNNHKTILIEVNDMYSLGGYGLNSLQYSLMIEDRWLELVNKIK